MISTRPPLPSHASILVSGINSAPPPAGTDRLADYGSAICRVDGERITRGTPQYLVLRALLPRRHRRRPRPRCTCPRFQRHTFATELANADVSVYVLMRLLVPESMVTSQRYVTAVDTETCTAAAQHNSTAY